MNDHDLNAPTHAHILGEIRALRDSTIAWRTSAEARIGGVEGRLTEVETTLKRNMEMTEQVRDAVVAAKVAHAVMKWVSSLVVAGAAIWFTAKQLLGGSGSSGPTLGG